MRKFASTRSKPGRDVPARTQSPDDCSRPVPSRVVTSLHAVGDNLTAFVIAAFALTGSPGPATLGLSAAAAAFGLRQSLALLTGIIVGVLDRVRAAAAGLTGLILAQPLLGPVVKALSRPLHALARLAHRDRAAARRRAAGAAPTF